MFDLLVTFEVLGGWFPFVVIAVSICELMNKIVELIKISFRNMENIIMKNVIAAYHKNIKLVADMG